LETKPRKGFYLVWQSKACLENKTPEDDWRRFAPPIIFWGFNEAQSAVKLGKYCSIF